MAHDQPTYASVPGIRVFGMMCVKPTEQSIASQYAPRPSPPQKQNQYVPPASPSSYYQRLQKLTLNKLAQHKASEKPSSLATDTSDFTTRGIHIVSSPYVRDGPENREEPSDDGNVTDDLTSSTFETVSSSIATTTTPFITTDTMSTDSSVAATTITGSSSSSSSGSNEQTITTDAISRSKRATVLDLEQLFNKPITSIRKSRSTQTDVDDDDDWPNMPWDEISQQIRDIQWE